MTFFKKTSVFSLFVFGLTMMFATNLQASTDDYTDAELKQFAKAVLEVISIQQQGQMDMIAFIEEDGSMSLDRFNELMMQAQQVASMEDLDASAEEIQNFETLSEGIMLIQMEMEPKLIGAIEAKEISLEKYEEIMMVYQQNPELQMRIQGLLEEIQAEEEAALQQ